MNIEHVSTQNQQFWNELCGSQLAKQLGITDSSIKSLKKFDDWYFDFYPYLFDHIPFADLKGKDVLEVGLGYGTVSQKIAEAGANYQGLDIAEGPVEMVKHRLQQARLKGKTIQGSILNPPFAPNSFDVVVAIGCFHHTGNIKLAIDNSYNLLRPGGKLILMVYYAYSSRRFRMAFIKTMLYMAKESAGYRGCVENSSKDERVAYDKNSDGSGAPHTDWVSIRSLKDMCSRFTECNATLENIAQEIPFIVISRDRLLKTRWPKLLGLDLYATAIK